MADYDLMTGVKKAYEAYSPTNKPTAADVGAEPQGAVTSHEGKANAHPISGVAGLQAALDGKYSPANKPTASEVGALSNTQMMVTGGPSPHYIKLADLDTNIGANVSGVTGIISGGSDFGTNVVPCFYFSASTRGYSDGTAALKMVNFVDGSAASGMELFSVLNGARTEIWLKTTTYPYEVKVSFLSGAAYNTFPANNTTTQPSGIVSRLVPTAVYHTGFKPTAADIQNVVSPVSSGGIIERGSNANGEYVRFADGTMICTVTNFTLVNPVAAASRYIEKHITFPAAFIDLNYSSSFVVSGNGANHINWPSWSSDSHGGSAVSNRATGSATCGIYATVNGTTPNYWGVGSEARDCSFIAIGRWK